MHICIYYIYIYIYLCICIFVQNLGPGGGVLFSIVPDYTTNQILSYGFWTSIRLTPGR